MGLQRLQDWSLGLEFKISGLGFRVDGQVVALRLNSRYFALFNGIVDCLQAFRGLVDISGP